MSSFAERFKLLRIRSKLTQEELAKQLELSKSTISMYENGNREPDFDTLEQIADFFKVDPNFLLGSNVPAYGNNPDPNNGQLEGYYIDPETVEKIHEIYDDPNLRVLFDAKRDLSPQDLDFICRTINILRKGEQNED